MADQTGARIRERVRRQINRRVEGSRTGATKAELRSVLEAGTPETVLRYALKLKRATMASASANDLFDTLYGIAWSRAHGRPLSEYFLTAWGVDHGDLDMEAGSGGCPPQNGWSGGKRHPSKKRIDGTAVRREP